MENIDIKKIVLIVAIILILILGAFFIVKAIDTANKKYEREKISEEDYKYFSIYQDEKFGVIDKVGEIVVQNSYSNTVVPNPTKDLFICINEDGKSEVLNKDKEQLFKDFEEVREIETDGGIMPYEISLLKYKQNGKYGLINFEGKVITKPIYDEISSLKNKEGEILAKKDGKYGVINNKGKVLIPFDYEEIEADGYYKDGYDETGYIVKSKTENGYRYGYINSDWKKVLNTEYTALSRVTDIDGKDIYIFAAKNRTIWTYEKQKSSNKFWISRNKIQ